MYKIFVSKFSIELTDEGELVLLGIDLRLVSGNGPEMAQIGFVTHEHDHDVLVRVIAQLLQPSLHILIGHVLCCKKKTFRTGKKRRDDLLDFSKRNGDCPEMII